MGKIREIDLSIIDILPGEIEEKKTPDELLNEIREKKSVKKSSIIKSSLPPAVKESLFVILKETHKRYKKFGYNGYLGHVNIIAAHFHLTEGL